MSSKGNKMHSPCRNITIGGGEYTQFETHKKPMRVISLENLKKELKEESTVRK
jgi:hypothetical protein